MWILLQLLRALPRNLLSRLIGSLAHIELPAPLSTYLVRFFVRLVSIDASEAAQPPESYPSIGAYFVRDLRPGVRPLGSGALSPVDGTLREAGSIVAGTLPQIKGWSYSVTEFLASDEEAKRYDEGQFFNFYLSPRDYHHVHAPLDAEIIAYTYIPGTLWPVNETSLHAVPKLFCKNERIAITMRAGELVFTLVMVGATNVGKMSLTFDSLISNEKGAWSSALTLSTKSFEPGIRVEKGERLGTFHLGSSVVMLFPAGSLSIPEDLGGARKLPVLYGESLAKFC